MKKLVVLLVVVAVGLWMYFSTSSIQSPLVDGMYLSYDSGGTTYRITFKKIDEKRFRATITPGDSEEIVTANLRDSNGQVYEAGSLGLGPLWIPPDSVKAGGHAYGDTVDEVKRWKKWDVGVIRASFGAGRALRGEWYYDRNTGFLVGGSKTTAVSAQGEGWHFVLNGTNIQGLAGGE